MDVVSSENLASLRANVACCCRYRWEVDGWFAGGVQFEDYLTMVGDGATLCGPHARFHGEEVGSCYGWSVSVEVEPTCAVTA